jgi:hypothetical protein
MKTRRTSFSIASFTGKLLMLLLIPVLMQAQFKTIGWYEEWAQRPLGVSGWGLPVWEYNQWNKFNVVVYFTNADVNSNSAPYFTLIPNNMGNGGADSIGVFYGTDGKAYIDSFATVLHRYGCAAVLDINQANPTNMNAIITDSVKVEQFSQSIAMWCKRHNFDGIDLNYESTAPTQANMSRLLRRLRYNINKYITSYHSSLSRPWFSIASPWEWAGDPYILADEPLVDMYCWQQGTLEYVYSSSLCGGNVNWPGVGISLGKWATSSWAQSKDLWISSFTEDASWIPSGSKPRGIRKAVSLGFSKSKIAPAGNIGGGNVKRGSDTLFGCQTADVMKSRSQIKDLYAIGGVNHWDANLQTEYISGTATGSAYTTEWWGGISKGEKFFAPIADSMSYYKRSPLLSR